MSTDQYRPSGHGEAVEVPDPAEKHDHPSALKEAVVILTDVNSGDVLEDQDGKLLATKSSHQDAVEMKRMGKDQQLIRNFKQLSIISFVGIATVAWELGMFVLTPGLVDGGRAGLIWNALWNFVGFGPVYLSMAEMASMAPIAGAQYHVSFCSVRDCRIQLTRYSGLASSHLNGIKGS